MNQREERWNEMRDEYKERTMSKEQVDKMKSMIAKAKKENRHTVSKIIATAAAIAIILTVLPNTSGSIAHAMSRVPILSKWVEVVTFRNYQYESDRHSADIQVPEIVPQVSEEQTEDTVNADSVQQEVNKTAEEINAEIQSIADELIDEFKENVKDQDGYQDVRVQSEIIATTERYFALKLICYQGAGSGAEWDYYYTIDLESGKRLQLNDLFAENSDYITLISESIKQQMKDQMAKDENVTYWLESDIPEWNFKEITEETGFYLNENGEVVICFNEGDVAPMYMGCVEFVIPNDVLKEIRK